MPPKRARAATKATAPIPSTNVGHPIASQIASALQRGRPHNLSYHAFIKSRHTPSTSTNKKHNSQAKNTGLDEPVENAIEAVVLQRKLLKWFDACRTSRGMPWRKDVDPATLSDKDKSQRAYEVWVSEIMLQQTQVATVIDYWNRWMAKLPTIAKLAAADPELVNECWKGLGYYSRATRLQAGAQKVMQQHAGRVPETAQELLDIDGIGPYSAGAISSIAFAQRSPMVDGNIQRVLSRLTALHGPATAKTTTNFIWTLADVLVPSQKLGQTTLKDVGGMNKPGAWNQALMELGATVCTPKNPSCHECPLSDECLAYAEVRFAKHERKALKCGDDVERDIEDLCSICAPIDDFDPMDHSVTLYPMAKERKKPREEETAVCVLEWIKSGADLKTSEKQVLLVKRPEKGLLAGLYEFPAVDIPPSDELSTSKTRVDLLNNVVSTLLASKLRLENGFTSSEENNNKIAVRSIVELEPVKQVYSHQIRTYLVIKVVIESNRLPKLATPSIKSTSSDAKAYGVGRCKWVDEKDVANANTGGAVGKIWDERERRRKGLPSSSSSTTKTSNGFKKQQTTKAVNNGSTLDGWMKKGQVSGTAKPKSSSPAKKKRRITKNGYETGSSAGEDGGDDVVIVDDEDEPEPDFVPSGNYKKRTIALSSDDEDE
ncbi:hypothetical protein ACM66B_001848 [Microbotryomycetes sp. NB124-2]